jgi:hypothetical protein
MIGRTAIARAAALALLAVAVGAVRGEEKIHGADSLFIAPTVKIAWAVRKGASEDTTVVIIRIVNSAGVYRFLRLDGVDPFSQSRKVVVSVRSIEEQADIVIPRSGFANHPSCEILFYENEPTSVDHTPGLTIYYLGVPDTTPEFSNDEEVKTYLYKVLGASR